MQKSIPEKWSVELHQAITASEESMFKSSDNTLRNQMRAGQTGRVHSTSWPRKSQVEWTFSLRGFSDAYAAFRKAMGWEPLKSVP